MGPIEHESLAALAERGFRFSIDNLTDLRVDARELNERGFRFVKAPAALLFNRVGAASTDIHPADFSDLLGRFGIDLIADRIENESTVVDLLDYDVRFGQGFLFSPPRPVRAEALQGTAETTPRAISALAGSAGGRRPRRFPCSGARPTRPRRHAAQLSRYPCQISANDLSRWLATTTCCSATSGAWCITASPLFRRPATR